MSAYKAVIIGGAIFTKQKSNGATYSCLNVSIEDGPAKGLVVLATRTTITKDGLVKILPVIGDAVTVYHTVVPSTKEGEKNQHFFEISTGIMSATNSDLDTVFS